MSQRCSALLSITHRSSTPHIHKKCDALFSSHTSYEKRGAASAHRFVASICRHSLCRRRLRELLPPRHAHPSAPGHTVPCHRADQAASREDIYCSSANGRNHHAYLQIKKP